MHRIYANLLGVWTDITDEGIVGKDQPAALFFKEHLQYDSDNKKADCFQYDYLRIGFNGKSYRIHPSMIQIVEE